MGLGVWSSREKRGEEEEEEEETERGEEGRARESTSIQAPIGLHPGLNGYFDGYGEAEVLGSEVHIRRRHLGLAIRV